MDYTHVEEEIDIRGLLDKFKNNFFTILGIVSIVMIATVIYLYLSSNIYSSNVTISLDNEENSKLVIIPSHNLLKHSSTSERLELARVTLKSKKFITMVVDKVNTDKAFFIRKNFRREEVNNFLDLKIDIKYKNKSLYGKFVEIIPIDESSFLLKINAIKYENIHYYNKRVINEWFSLRIIQKKGSMSPFLDSFEEKIYTFLEDFPKTQSLFNIIDKRAYFFKLYDKSSQENLIIANMTVATLSDSILQIIYNDTLPKRAKRVAQEIANSYISYSLKNRTSELQKTLDFLDRQIVEVKLNLEDKGERLKNYQQENNTIVTMKSSEGLLGLVENKSEIVTNIDLQLQEIESFIHSLRDDVLNTVSLISSGIEISSIQSLINSYIDIESKIRAFDFQRNDISKSVTSNRQIIFLINELKKAKTILYILQNKFTDEHPEVMEEQANVYMLESKIDQTLSVNLEKLERDRAVIKSTILKNITMVQNNLKNKRALSQDYIQNKKEILHSLPTKNMVNQGLEYTFKFSQNIYTFLLQKKIEVEISKASVIANTKIIENAHLFGTPIKPKKMLIFLIAFILGMVLGVIYVLIKEFLIKTVRSISDLEKLTDVPIYGALPLKKSDRLFKEALRNVRSNLEFVPLKSKKCMTILISSTVGGEGKTTVSAGLGDILSQTNKKVLLMDLDLRKPSLYKELNQQNKVGMSYFLSTKMEYEELIVPISENLHFIAAGKVPPNPTELLMSEKFDKLMAILEERYDYIIFDTSPIGKVTDANIIVKYSDIFILIVRANKSEKRYLTAFNKMIKRKNINSSGIIFNDVKFSKNSSDIYGYGG